MKRSAGFAFVVGGDKILLSHATKAPWFGTFSIIKGEIEFNESEYDAALREFREETGFDLAPIVDNLSMTKMTVYGRDKELTAFITFIDSPHLIGMVTETTSKGSHTIYRKENLQLSEIDWAGLVSFEDAKKRMAPYQLPILDKISELKNSAVVKTDAVVKIDGYTFDKHFREYVNTIVGELPRQIHGIIKSIDNGEPGGISTMTFTEEVKDGRSARFNVLSPLKMIGKSFSLSGATLRVSDVRALPTEKQESDSDSDYIDYKYDVSYSISYQSKSKPVTAEPSTSTEPIKLAEPPINQKTSETSEKMEKEIETKKSEAIDMTKIISDNSKHVPYVPVSDICEENLGTVVPKGMVSEMMGALNIVKKKLQDSYGWDLDDYVQDRLAYSPEELDIDRKLYDSLSPAERKKLINSKLCTAFAGEQMDALALAIFNIEASVNGNGYGMIVGDMTGIGKGRIAAGLIRYCIKFHKKVPIFITEKGYLFSDIYRDLEDIKSDPAIPYLFRAPELDYQKQIKMSDAEIKAAIIERLDMGDSEEEAREAVEEMITKGYKTVLGYKINPSYARQEQELNKNILRIKPFILNAKKDETSIKDSKGNIIYQPLSGSDPSFKKILETKQLPDNYNMIMLTYSQINRAGVSLKSAFLKELARGSIVICDESHNASGVSNTGKYIFDLLSRAAGAAFLSATYSKRPDNMVVYASKTAIREAEMDEGALIAAIIRGGVPLQEIISSQLVAEGQMVRRERTYEGVDVLWNTMDSSMANTGHPEFDLKDKHSAIWNIFSQILRDIIELQNEHIKPWLRGMSKAELSQILVLAPGDPGQDVKKLLTSSPIFSRVFNVVNQLLLALKAEAFAERAISYMKQGKKPVIAFSSTMGAFLEQIKKDNGEPLEQGDQIDTDFRLVLERLLKTLLIISVKQPTGQSKRKIHLGPHNLPIEARNLYKNIESKIQRVSIGISISPIDVMLYKIQQAGYKAEEVTGRKAYIRFADDTFMRGTYEVRTRPDTTGIFRGFNENRIDCLLINQSGAVGASFQAAPNSVVKMVRYKSESGEEITTAYMKGMKQKLIIPSSLEPRNEIKQRVMLMLQAELNINTEVQKRGRIFRSGQVLPPMYEYLCSAIPAEQRLQMMMQKKLKSLDANVSSNQKSSDEVVNVVDFLNKIGDVIAVKYLFENKELIAKLGDPFDMIDDETGNIAMPKIFPDNAAHKLSGRIAVLSVSDQEKFYQEITQKYITEVKLLTDTGRYNGDVQFLDLQAETIDRQIFQVGSGGSSAFGRNTVLELCEVNNLRKPYTQKELILQLNEALSNFVTEDEVLFDEYDDSTGQKKYDVTKNLHAAALKKQIMALDLQQKFFENRKNNLGAKYEQNLKNSLEKLKEDSTYKKILKKNKDEAEKLMRGYILQVEEKNNTDREEEMLRITNQYQVVKNYLQKLQVGMVTWYTQGLLRVNAVVVDIRIDHGRANYGSNPYTPSAIEVKLAIANGIRMIYVPLSESEMINDLIVNRDFSASNIERVLTSWDVITKESMSDRIKRYIVTGNLLQAMGDSAIAENNGQLIKFTQRKNGRVFLRNGVMLSDTFDPSKHTGGRGSSFVLVPAKKCLPVLQRLEYDDRLAWDKQKLYETSNGIQISPSEYGKFLIRVPKDKAWKYIYADTRLTALLIDSEKGFTDKGWVDIWNSATLKKEPMKAMGAEVRRSDMQQVLDFLSDNYRASFKLSSSVFETVKADLDINLNTDYDDALGIEESESGLAQVQLKNYKSQEAEESVREQTTGLEQPKITEPEAIQEPEPQSEDAYVHTSVSEARILAEKMSMDYERKLFKLQRLLLTGKMATGGQPQDRKWVMSDFTNPGENRYSRFAVKPVDGGFGIYDRLELSFLKEVKAKGIRKQPPYKTEEEAKKASNQLNYEHNQHLDFMWNHEDGGEVGGDKRSEEIAAEIVRQLGGLNRLKLFTGLERGLILKNGVALFLPPSEFQKANYIKIVLNGQDLYDVEFGNKNGANYEKVSESLGVYEDMLVDIFEQGTGMYLHF